MKEFYFIFKVTKENEVIKEFNNLFGGYLPNESDSGIVRYKIKVKSNISMEELIDKLEKYYSMNGYKYICIGVIPLGEINVC